MSLNNYSNSFAPPFHWEFDDKTTGMTSDRKTYIHNFIA